MENPEEIQSKQEMKTPEASNIVKESLAKIKTEVQKVLVGMDDAIELSLAAIMVDGHILLEGFPGLAKTLLVKLVAQTVDVGFKRIQFTPDLMPADVLGTSVFDPKEGSFKFHRGPIFSNFVLIDEINRSPAKTQSALFEVMEERQVTNEGESLSLGFPFLVIATQNPIDQEGTYRLPEAQLDRFLFKIKVPYPSKEEERDMLLRFKEDFDQSLTKEVKPVIDAKTIKECQTFIEKIRIDDALIDYITALAQATRNHPSIYLGASPRASLSIMKASKALAAMAGRDFVSPDDVQTACIPILNHRILLTASAEMEGFSSEDLIKEVIDSIEVPR